MFGQRSMKTKMRVRLKRLGSSYNLAMSPRFLYSRTRLYVFEEFLMKWTDLLRSEQATSMTARLMKETDQYKVGQTLFVFCIYKIIPG